MISMLICTKSTQELGALRSESKELASRLTDEEWTYHCFSKEKEFREFLDSHPFLHLAVMDVMMQGGLSGARQVRSNDRSTYLILIASAACSPLVYIKPDILAGSLLLRPYTREQMEEVLKEAFFAYLSQRDGEEGFVVENRLGRQVIPYGQIIYFEAFDRKIRIHTEEKEVSFYGSLERLELPDRFVRCHRGFIIDRFRIRQVQLSKNTVFLEGGYCIPLSRSYKAAIKELMQRATDR